MPLNGQERDACGTTRANVNCNPGWFQAGGADVHSNAAITLSQGVPAGQFFNFNPAGVVSSSSTTSFTPAQANSRQWLLQAYPGSNASILINPRYDHDYFWNLYRSKVVKTLTQDNINNGDIQTPGSGVDIIAVHPASGNTITYNNSATLSGNKYTVVFINKTDGTAANLVISQDLNLGTAFVVFIVSGNVTINPSVARADGYYVTSGTYNSGSGQTQLQVSGGVAAYGGINLGRRMATATTPAEVFTYNPLITQFSQRIGGSFFAWIEVAP